MMRKQYTFTFGDEVPMGDVEQTLLMAVVAAEGIHGRAKVRLESEFESKPEARTCLVSADSEVGQCISKVFTELLVLDFGESAFEVRIDNAPVGESNRSQV